MSRVALGWLLLGAVGPAAGLELGCDEPGGQVRLPAGVLSVQVQVPAAQSWQLRIDESGLDLEWSQGADARFRGIELRPPRLGATLIQGSGSTELQLRLAGGRTDDAAAQLRFACAGPATEAPETDCWAATEAAFAQDDRAALVQLAGASTPCAPFARHALATLQSRHAQFVAAADSYRLTEQQWRLAGDPQRAAVTVLARAEQALQLVDFAATTALAERAADELNALGLAYFAARAQVTQAIAQAQSGKPDTAFRLLDAAQQRFADLRELGEVANVLYNQAAVRRVKGDRRAAQSYLAQARALPASAQTPVTRGRLALLASELNMLAGSPAAALTELAAADSAFLQGGLRSWQGTALLRRAHLYTGLGMHDEAYRAVHEALHTFVPKEAPARIADALQEMASLALDQDQFADAHHWSTLAQGIYRTLHLDVEMAWAGLSELEAALRSGDAGADAELAALAKQHPHLRYDARYCLARARGALLKPDPAAALTWLDDTQCWGLGEAERLSAASLRAAALHAQGQTDRALTALDVAGSELGERAAAASGAGLAFAAVRQAVRLRDVAALIAHDQPARLSAQRWFALALNSNPQMAAARAGGAASTLELAASDQLAELLLADEPTRRKLDQQMARSQLQALARPAAALPKPAGTTTALPDVQRALPSDALMLVVIPAEPGSVALWIAHDSVSVVPLPGRRAMADAVASLQASLASSDRSQDGVSRAAAEVSAVMLSGAPSGPPPRQLWVLSDELIGTAPLALLHWPGASQPLIETTDLSWITTIAPAPPGLAVGPADASATRSIDVLVAANTGAEASTHLAPLLSADYEPQLIASAGERLRVRPKVGGEASREALADALQSPAAWVHLAAHGYAKPSLLGYAGVWMAPAPGGGEPQFLSWLDIADLPLKADLAVLNACQLAAGPSATSQSSLSFAAAVSTAGVANVIAASWPVSDAATQVWVPAFYRAVDPARADSSAGALRAAQLALRRSRHFRHPYYWASLGHFRHLLVAPQPAAAQP